MRQLALPTASLSSVVRHVMTGGFESDRVHLPACADVQLLVYLKGGASLIDPHGAELPLPSVFLVGAVMHPRVYYVQPGSRFVAITFRPGGLHACLGISAADVTGRIAPLDLAERDLLALLAADEADAGCVLQAILENAMQAHGAGTPAIPVLDHATLNQPIPKLAREFGISARQFERRCLVSLGMPLREYRRLARYSTAMAALMVQGAAPVSLANLAQEAGYVDQAHLTRDFAVMVGQPPGRFTRQRADPRYQLWQFSPEELATYLT